LATPHIFTDLAGTSITKAAGLLGDGTLTTVLHSYDHPSYTTITWKKNDYDITNILNDDLTPKWTVINTGTTGPNGTYGTISTIQRNTIANGTLYAGDDGTYTCEISDRFGTAVKTFTISLVAGSTGPIPVFINSTFDRLSNRRN
jgi:hypothetical protein